ncbi:MAG: hypothetical protein EB165_07870 [Euryarchaeota archaeon]|nr:hypothetical protein [Euryarchaeota archaeon]NDB94538.1 hypothetical protein [Euryarchaeota archaeon]
MDNDFSHIQGVHLALLILIRLIDGTEEDLEMIPSRQVGPLLMWVMKERITEKIMQIDQWMELGFHLCKQRWDSTVDWLEDQPISKIMLMLRIQTKYVEEQNREQRKASKRR